ncbi:hypothetical protein [Micromonospora sp. NBC_00860]|uniref:hypothetical protein n=1 Tax=Micromonospora sp. NBC_00860 TaxID=2975980 RepID=UPI00386A17BF|nr:hypothetical protein OH804_31045 [Micromonospora sp. NBC_00860]
MSHRDWERLTNVERAFFTNAFESDLLAGVFGDLDPAERDMPLGELAQILLSLVDRGFIEVRRYARWIADDGREGLTPGEVIPRRDLPQLLADPETWEYPDDSSWAGAITLVETDAGRSLSRISPDEMLHDEP